MDMFKKRKYWCVKDSFNNLKNEQCHYSIDFKVNHDITMLSKFPNICVVQHICHLKHWMMTIFPNKVLLLIVKLFSFFFWCLGNENYFHSLFWNWQSRGSTRSYASQFSPAQKYRSNKQFGFNLLCFFLFYLFNWYSI